MINNRHAPNRIKWWEAAAASALVLAVAILPLGSPSLVVAHTSRGLPSPSSFALAPTLFPHGATVRGRRTNERSLQRASGLHLIALSKMDYLEGFSESATWKAMGPGRHNTGVSLQYLVSVFGTPGGAEEAYGDAQASLWESGRVSGSRTADSRVFMLTRRSGIDAAYLLLHRGAIEMELRLRYSRALNARSVGSELSHLKRAGAAAWTRAKQLAPGLPLVPSSSSDPQNAVRTSPWGTGPVVKSASLMALDTSSLGADAQLAPGAFRPFHGPDSAALAIHHPALVSERGLQRFVQTGSTPTRNYWYGATSLYSDATNADHAFTALQRANRHRAWLRPYSLDPEVWHTGRLAALDGAQAWRMKGETVFSFRVQNVLMILATSGEVPGDAAPVVKSLVGTVPTWLHARGTDTVTATSEPVRLASVNWYGAEENDFVVGGLDFQSYEAILWKIKALGFNSIRLPISNQLVEEDPVVTEHVGKNPELRGLHAMDILDLIINYAGTLGISVVLDNHRSDAGWSTDPSGLWYTSAYPDSAFVADWATVARRFSTSNVVIGADLRNEPHGKASWADANPATDWHSAAERAGNAVLTANPRLLVIVEGIQYYKQAVSYWWGGSLMGVVDAPVVLHFSDGTPARSQLVYSVHDYGPRLCGKGCPWFNKTTTYASLSQVWQQYWGFVLDDPKQPYSAPVWVGEFGTCDYQRNCVQDGEPGSQGQWFSSLVKYIGEKRVGWSYWSVNGTESTAGSRVYGTLDWYGFLDHSWTRPYSWLEEGLSPLLLATAALPQP